MIKMEESESRVPFGRAQILDKQSDMTVQADKQDNLSLIGLCWLSLLFVVKGKRKAAADT